MGSTKTETAKMPQFQEDFLKETVIPFAEDFLATPYESYTGERVAGMTPLQQQAMTGYGGLNMGGDLYGAASDVYGGLSEFQAPELAGTQIGEVGSIADVDIQKYMSPYTQEVIDRGMADIARQQEIGMGKLGAAASKAGAFGGSRHGVAEGVAAGEYGRLAGDFAAKQRQAAFQSAMGLASGDIGRQQQRALSQASLDQQSALARQRAALQAAGIRGTAASGLGSIAGQQLQSQLAGLGAQTAAGEAQRALAQAQLDVPYQDYLAAMQYPLTQFGVLTGAAGAIPQGFGTTTARSGGLGPALGALGSIGMGFGMAGLGPLQGLKGSGLGFNPFSLGN